VLPGGLMLGFSCSPDMDQAPAIGGLFSSKAITLPTRHILPEMTIDGASQVRIWRNGASGGVPGDPDIASLGVDANHGCRRLCPDHHERRSGTRNEVDHDQPQGQGDRARRRVDSW
jgi:hypothetical protein